MIMNEVKSENPSTKQGVTQTDFLSLKLVVKDQLKSVQKNINHRFKSMETALVLKMTFINAIIVVVVFIVCAYINDYRPDFIK